MMKKPRLGMAFAIALLGGIVTSLAYVHYPAEEITLSHVVICLSGGNPENTLLDMMSLAIQFLPVYVFCAFAGTGIYRHFCTASVYVFSRQPKRLRWYMREWGDLLLMTVLFQAIYIGTAVATSMLRLEVAWELRGIRMLACHFLIHTLWTGALSIMINIFSIFLGSDAGYILGIGINTVWVTIMASAYMNGTPELIGANPVARLIMAWHSICTGLADVSNSARFHLDVNMSVLYMLVLYIAAVIACGIIVMKYDLLTGNKETGGTS